MFTQLQQRDLHKEALPTQRLECVDSQQQCALELKCMCVCVYVCGAHLEALLTHTHARQRCVRCLLK